MDNLLSKPVFKQGDKVKFHITSEENHPWFTGTICGKVVENVVDFWLIRLDEKFPDYEFDTISMIHTMIKRV